MNQAKTASYSKLQQETIPGSQSMLMEKKAKKYSLHQVNQVVGPLLNISYSPSQTMAEQFSREMVRH